MLFSSSLSELAFYASHKFSRLHFQCGKSFFYVIDKELWVFFVKKWKLLEKWNPPLSFTRTNTKWLWSTRISLLSHHQQFIQKHISISARFISHCRALSADLIWDDCSLHNEIKININNRIGRQSKKVFKHFHIVWGKHFSVQLTLLTEAFGWGWEMCGWNFLWVWKLNFELFLSLLYLW